MKIGRVSWLTFPLSFAVDIDFPRGILVQLPYLHSANVQVCDGIVCKLL